MSIVSGTSDLFFKVCGSSHRGARDDKMMELVDRMLQLNKQKHSGKLAPSQVDRVDREIAATDAETDVLVYELYGLTEEERKIVEGG